VNRPAEPRWRRWCRRPGRGIRLNMSGPSQPSGVLAKRVLAMLLGLAITVLAVAQYRTGRGPVVVAWLAVGPLLASLLLRPWITAVLAGWATLLGVGGRTRWLIGDTRGKGLPAVRLASIATTSFRDACAQPGLSLAEIARVVDRSVTLAAGEEDFVTALFAEFDPRGWLELALRLARAR
jgi:phosphoserine phosphatase RsbU/P